MKRCSKCKQILDESEFGKNKSRKDGLQFYCKDCQKEYYTNNHKEILERNRENYKKDPEKSKKRFKKYRENNLEKCREREIERYKNHRNEILERERERRKNNLEKFKKRDREYREKNLEKVKKRSRENIRKYRKKDPEKFRKRDRERMREDRKANPEKHRGRDRKRYKANPEKYREHSRRRRLKKLQLFEDYTIEEERLKRNKTKGFCQGCGKYIGVDKLTVDHEPSVSAAPIGFTYTIDDIRFLCGSCNSSKHTTEFDIWIKRVDKRDPIEVQI